MKPLDAVREYHYWSKRLVAKFWDGNVSQLPKKLLTSVGISHFSVQAQSPDLPETHAARAAIIEKLLADQVVTGSQKVGPGSYIKGRSQMVLSSLRNELGKDSGAVTLFTDIQNGQGKRIALCLFGSARNVDGWEPTVPEWRQFGWTSSHNNGVRLLLNAGQNAEDSDDATAFWLHGAEEARASVDEICWNALNICYGQGAYLADGDRPWRRGYTIGHYHDAEWLARIYFSCAEILNVPGLNTFELFDEVHVGAAFWVRTESVRAWVPYTMENVQKLNAAEPLMVRSRKPFGRLKRRIEFAHEPYPEILPD